MQYKLILAAAAALSIVACTPAAMTPPADTDSTASVPGPADDSDSMVDEPTGGEVRIVDVTVTDWSFTPNMITAKKGEKVKLRLKGGTGIHGVLVADLGLNLRIQSGEETVVDLPTDKAGTFAGKCNVPCGPGHRDMTFTIVIE